MKPGFKIYAIIIIIGISAVKSYGQQPDSIKRHAVTYLSHQLGADTLTAKKVINIQEGYKRSVQRLLGSSLTDQQRRVAIDQLIDQKNQQLETLLSPHQRDIIIPMTERRSTWKADTTAYKKH
jgi:hypothetical protein